jgi:hypothetical protein
MVGLHAQRVNDVTVCTVGSEPWRGSLSDRTLIAETGAPLFSFQPCHRHAETRIGAAVWVPGVDRATVSPAGRMLTPTPTWTGPTVSRVSQSSRKSSCGARRNRFMSSRNQRSEPPGMATTSPEPQTRCSSP